MIPGIDVDKVNRYGPIFLKLVREAQAKYEEMSGTGNSGAPSAPSHRAGNAIDISSDEEDYGDEDMADFINDQELNELSQNERSAYFEPEMPPPPGPNSQCEMASS